jgi:mannosyl-oligosaccharide glucosidase
VNVGDVVLPHSVSHSLSLCLRKGPIWININYLLVSSLYNNYIDHERAAADDAHIATVRQLANGTYDRSGDAGTVRRRRVRALYTMLREALITNIESNYRRTGYLWEQYSATDGDCARASEFLL